MRTTIRFGAVVGALTVVAALNMTALAVGSGAGDPPRVTMPRISLSEGRAPGPSGTEPRLNSSQDVRGNCDEAEHATDPACPASTVAGTGRSGPGNGDPSGSAGAGEDHLSSGDGGDD